MSQVHPSKRSCVIIFAGVALFVFALSQLGSYLIDSNLPIRETYVVNSVLHITHVRNFGGVFGLFQGAGNIFSIVSGIVIVLFVFFVYGYNDYNVFHYICFGLVLGGGASNICDRMIYGSVIDFIDVQGIPYWHFVFNTADVMIHLGVWPIMLMSMIGKKVEESARKI